MNIKERVVDTIARELRLEENEISEDYYFEKDLDVDSLDFPGIVMALEEEFDIEIPDEKVDDSTTVSGLIQRVKELVCVQ